MKNKNAFKSGLGFGIMMAIFNVCWNLFTADELTGKLIAKAFISGLIGGFIGGLFFGLTMRWMEKSKYLEPKVLFDLEADEEIIFQTGANHFKGIEAVGGLLTLTNQRLVFQAHYLNIQNHQLFIDLQNIRSFSRYKTLKIVNNGLLITTAETVVEKFVVQQPEKWFECLSERVSTVLI